MIIIRPCLIIVEMSNGESFFARRRQFDAGVLDVRQGKLAKHGGKRSASGHFDNYQTRPNFYLATYLSHTCGIFDFIKEA